MANCQRCGRTKIRKRKDGRRKCARCGYLPNNRNLDRSGNPPFRCETPAPEGAAA